MPRLPADVIGDAYTSTHAWDVLTELVDIGSRTAGHESEAEAAQVIARAFESYARDVEVTEFDIPGWWRGSSSFVLERADGRTELFESDMDVIALPGSCAGTVEAELVDVGYGTPEEFESADLAGSIAMASSETPADSDRWIHRMEKYVSAVEGGAEAFVFANHVDGCLPPTGEVGYRNGTGSIPAVGVSSEVGARLARHCEDGASVSLDVDCRSAPATSQNVEAVVGPDTDREVLVSAHVDAHDISEGASDNGVGCALVVEIGRLLARVADDLDTRVRLVTFGAEESGLWGASHWVENCDRENVKCVLNIDGVSDSRNVWVGTNGFDEIGRVFESVTDDLDAPLVTDDAVSPHADQWAFVKEGIPGVMASSTSESDGRGWGHTHADTLDKLDVRNVRALAIAFADCVVRLSDEDCTIEPRSRDETREMMEETQVLGLKNSGRWPYDE